MATRPRGDSGRREATVAGAEVGEAVLDDGMLMAGVVAEQMDAFEALYRLYHPRLVRFLDGMTRRPALVEEILDDTVLVVWRRAHTWLPTAKVSTWIFGIAYRQALKALRRSDLAMAATDDPPIPAEAEPDGELQHLQLREHLGAALGALSMEHRAVMELTYYQGYSCREIAEIMACPVATVKTRMFYARQKLRVLLGQRGEQAL